MTGSTWCLQIPPSLLDGFLDHKPGHTRVVTKRNKPLKCKPYQATRETRGTAGATLSYVLPPCRGACTSSSSPTFTPVTLTLSISRNIQSKLTRRTLICVCTEQCDPIVTRNFLSACVCRAREVQATPVCASDLETAASVRVRDQLLCTSGSHQQTKPPFSCSRLWWQVATARPF